MKDVVATTRHGRLAVLEDGSVCALSILLDADGDETDDPDEAVTGVVDLPDGTFAVVVFCDFDVVPIQ